MGKEEYDEAMIQKALAETRKFRTEARFLEVMAERTRAEIKVFFQEEMKLNFEIDLLKIEVVSARQKLREESNKERLRDGWSEEEVRAEFPSEVFRKELDEKLDEVGSRPHKAPPLTVRQEDIS